MQHEHVSGKTDGVPKCVGTSSLKKLCAECKFFREFKPTHFRNIVPSKVDNMRAKLANLNDCAVPFLSRVAVNLCWYYSIQVALQPQEPGV